MTAREPVRLALASLLMQLPLAAVAFATQSAPGTGELYVDAGPDRFLLPPATSLTLQGFIGGIRASEIPSHTRISWIQLSGPPATILNQGTLRPTIVPNRPGILRLRLKVSEPSYGFAMDEVTVSVFGQSQDAVMAGVGRKWNKLALTFQHDAVLSEQGTPNPFLDLRLIVHFYNPESGELTAVPGYFAADGDAAETSATSGDRWRVNFCPDHVGTWYYLACFRSGPGIALDPAPEAGLAVSFDGANGSFFVEPSNPNAPGFLSMGRLEYVGQHHLRCAETREFFLKGGAGSPENFFGYYEFDDTFDQGNSPNGLNNFGWQDGLHHFDAHFFDYVPLGAPLWKDGQGRRICGALNYLAAHGVNSLYALTYNIDGGDGREIWPWFPATDKLRFDVSKLEQWERVVDHMMRCGIAWQVMTQETENDHVLDLGALGPQRKLYYRELVARFGHAPGLVWNLGEENDNSTAERMAFADYLREIDPYDHPIALHNHVDDIDGAFVPLLGTHLELVSLQGDPGLIPDTAQILVDDSTAAGRAWVVNFDEQNPASDGVVPDTVDFWHDMIRQEALWPTLLAQGGGCEWYFGYAYPNSDIDCEDFGTRENLWQITKVALDFFREHLPFEDMLHADDLGLGDGVKVLAKRGEFYALYLPSGGPAGLRLEANTGPYRVSWFDAKNGGPLQDGSVTQIIGPGTRALGLPPGPGDWLAFVRRETNFAPAIESITVEPDPFLSGMDFSVTIHARDPNGPFDELTVRVEAWSPTGELSSSFLARHRGGSLYALFLANAPALLPGTWQLVVTVQDEAGASATGTAVFEAQ